MLVLLAAPAGAASDANTASMAGAAERIVTLAPHLAELVFAAGAGDQLVAVTRHSDFPEQVKRLPQVGDGINLHAEALLDARSTLVLVWEGGTPVAAQQQLQRIAQADVAEFRIEPIRVMTLDDVPAAVRHIGQLAGTQTHADTTADALEVRIRALEQPGRASLRVFYQVSSQPIFTLNGSTATSDLIRRCGGVNVFAALPMTAPQVGKESVVMARPDVILMGSPRGKRLWRGFDVIPAVAEDQMIVIDADLLARPGPRLVDGAEQVCAVLDAARVAR